MRCRWIWPPSSSLGGTLEEHSRFHDTSPGRTIHCSPQSVARNLIWSITIQQVMIYACINCSSTSLRDGLSDCGCAGGDTGAGVVRRRDGAPRRDVLVAVRGRHGRTARDAAVRLVGQLSALPDAEQLPSHSRYVCVASLARNSLSILTALFQVNLG